LRKELSLLPVVWLMLLWSAPVGPLAGNQQPVGGLAYAQTPSFYQGKTIRIIVGSDSL